MNDRQPNTELRGFSLEDAAAPQKPIFVSAKEEEEAASERAINSGFGEVHGRTARDAQLPVLSFMSIRPSTSFTP